MLRFRDMAAAAGLTFQAGIQGKTPLNIVEISGGGAGFLDADGDGWPDIVLAGYSGCALYRNRGGGRFENVTAGSGLDRLSGAWQGVACGDYDGDGRTDLVLTGHGHLALLRSKGGCRFTDVTRAAGLTLDRWSTSAGFADVNGDGWLDLYVACYVEFRPGMPEFFEGPEARLTIGPDAYDAQKGVLYLNRGNGRFVDATRAAGLLAAHGKGLGVAFADYDDDGDSDLYVANDRVPGDFFRNDGKGHFTSVGAENGTALSAAGNRQAGMGSCWGDYDGDGRLDLVVTTFSQEPKALYRQQEGGLFVESGTAAGFSQTTLPWVAFGVMFADWDNDGWLDLMVANGHVQDQADRVNLELGYRQPTLLFRNRGNGTFEDVSGTAGEAFLRRIVGRALAVADYDRDGRPDALVGNLAGPPLLLHNETPAGNWVAVRLRGRPPNPEGIGARVRLSAGTRTQIREVRADGSYLSASEPIAHFGLGAEPGPIQLEIRWPDGTRQHLENVPANSLVEAHQPAAVGK
jgi:hypothetical protein